MIIDELITLFILFDIILKILLPDKIIIPIMHRLINKLFVYHNNDNGPIIIT